MRRRYGDAVQETYALGGGRSGAEPEVAGIVTISAMTLLADEVASTARPSAGAAPRDVTQAMELAQVPCEGLEQGACSEDAISPGVPARTFVVSARTVVPMSAMDAIAACADGEPLMAAIPGVVHTAPPVTIVRCPTNRARSSPAERRRQCNIS